MQSLVYSVQSLKYVAAPLARTRWNRLQMFDTWSCIIRPVALPVSRGGRAVQEVRYMEECKACKAYNIRERLTALSSCSPGDTAPLTTGPSSKQAGPSMSKVAVTLPTPYPQPPLRARGAVPKSLA